METMNDDTATLNLIKSEVEDHDRQQRLLTKQLNILVSEVASEMGLMLTKVQLVDGRRLGCRDAHLIKIKANGNLVSTIIHEGEFRMEAGSAHMERAKGKIRGVLETLRQPPDFQ